MDDGCICVSGSIRVDSYAGSGRRSEELALAAEAAAAGSLVFEFDQAAGGLEDLEVLLAIEGGEHSGVVGEGCDGGADAAAERFAAGAATKVVVAARAGGLRDELQLPRAGPQLDYRLSAQVAVELEWLAVRSAGPELIERLLESAQVLVLEGGDDVDPVGELGAAVDHATQRADHDVTNAFRVQGLYDRDRIEVRSRHQR